MRGQNIAGGVIVLVGVLVLLFGLYRVLTSQFEASNIQSIVANGFAFMLYGAVIFIVGVVDAGFKNWIALALHVGSVVPYYFAIQGVIATGQTQSQEVGTYLNATLIPWIIGILLNVLGIAMNRVKVGAKRGAAPAPEPTAALDPFEPPAAPPSS